MMEEVRRPLLVFEMLLGELRQLLALSFPERCERVDVHGGDFGGLRVLSQ